MFAIGQLNKMEAGKRMQGTEVIVLTGVCLVMIGNVFCIPDVFVDRFRTPSVLLTGIIMGIWGIFWCLASPKKPFYLPDIKFLIGILVYMFYEIINGADGVFLLMNLCYFLFLFDGLCRCKRVKPVIGVICLLLACCTSLFAFLQYLNCIPSYHAVFTVTGPFDNPAGLACLLAVLFPVTLLFLASRTLIIKILSVAIGIFIIGIILLSASRTALLSVFVVLVIYSCYKMLHWKLSILLGCISLLIIYLLYKINPASADGRILVWNCCLMMITDNIWTGIGIGNFQKDYMMAQADFFKLHPGSSDAMLAGNVQHPFNEFIGLLAEQGVIGFVLVACLLGYVIRQVYLHVASDRKIILLFLLSFAVCSSFSYPFDYPIFHILLITLVAVMLSNDPKVEVKFPKWRFLFLILLFFLFLISDSIRKGHDELRWYNACSAVEEGEISKQDVERFSSLYNNSYLKDNGDFLYNYAVILYEVAEYSKCLSVLERCQSRIRDYDVQLLIGYNNLALKDYCSAENAYQTASRMIPNRLLPRYELMRLYNLTGQTSMAVRMAQEIVEQPLKITSPKALLMKQEAMEYMSNNLKERR